MIPSDLQLAFCQQLAAIQDRARLHDNRLVAVKVRRPCIEDALAHELSLVRVLFHLSTRGNLDSAGAGDGVRYRRADV